MILDNDTRLSANTVPAPLGILIVFELLDEFAQEFGTGWSR